MKITKEYLYNGSTTPTPIYLASLNSNPVLFAYGSTHAQAISNLLGLILLAKLINPQSHATNQSSRQ